MCVCGGGVFDCEYTLVVVRIVLSKQRSFSCRCPCIIFPSFVLFLLSLFFFIPLDLSLFFLVLTEIFDIDVNRYQHEILAKVSFCLHEMKNCLTFSCSLERNLHQFPPNFFCPYERNFHHFPPWHKNKYVFTQLLMKGPSI